MKANWILSIILTILAAPGFAQQSLDSTFRTTGATVVAAFEPQRQFLQNSSAVMRDGREEICYGVVISSDGYILTKASEIQDAKELVATIDQTNYPGAKVITIDQAWDVALVKIEASGLTPVTYAPTSAVPQGTWVVANGATTRTSRRLLPGIISAKIREIPATGGAGLGVTLDPKAKNLLVTDVNDRSGAKDAGVQKGDVILAVEGKKMKTVQELGEFLKDRKAGSSVKVTLKRKGQELTMDVRLVARAEMYDQMLNRNDMMSGDFSVRRSGFPRVMQHDILGSRKIVGGPLLDLDGRCIGMNIARANRAESFAIPVEDLKELAERLVK